MSLSEKAEFERGREGVMETNKTEGARGHRPLYVERRKCPRTEIHSRKGKGELPRGSSPVSSEKALLS